MNLVPAIWRTRSLLYGVLVPITWRARFLLYGMSIINYKGVSKRRERYYECCIELPRLLRAANSLHVLRPFFEQLQGFYQFFSCGLTFGRLSGYCSYS